MIQFILPHKVGRLLTSRRVFGLPARSEISHIIPDPYHSIHLESPKHVTGETDKLISIECQDPETKEKFTRTLYKITDSVYAEHLNATSLEKVTVSSIDQSSLLPLPTQEFEQACKDSAALKMHEYNKHKLDKNARFFVPFHGELVDKQLNQDPDSFR